MLEVRNLTKMYKPKRGVPVLAVDHINLRFPETGMVFLLGKSGSGKSTMLNLLGGLDVCDEGEIIIKGKSSANFKQRDFDSYRNTYLGFIFQEYNILEEFNVGANIALALQLQGQKATDERINQILEQVDLAGYGMRKPNELSGGQKQRVAIARALVKDPEIIMADEPTGALDSVTGRQVLDTLKRLSEQKLVIVVSHDREFAERYADRIIELADGHVISDMEYEAGDYDSFEETRESVPSGLTFTQEMVYVAPQYHLTEEDREAINNWIDAQSNGGAIAIGNGNANATAMHGSRVATPTDQSRIIPLNNSPFRLIKSKLPMKNAFKIGASGLKYKKFRLVITIILSCVAFGLFGLADTLGSYDHISTCSKSIVDTGVNYASFQKSIFYKYDSISEGYWSTGGYKMTAEDVEQIQKDTGISVVGAYVPDIWEVSETNNGRFDTQYDVETEFTETMYHIYAYGFSGIAALDEQMLEDSGFKLIAGRLADGSKDEMVISSYVAQTFIKAGYREYGSEGSFTDIQDEADMVGKTLYVGGRNMEIVGVVDTGFELSRYETLVKENKGENSLDLVLDVALNSELRKARECSFLEMMMVGDGFVERMLEESPKVATVSETDYLEFYTEDQKGESAYYLSEDFYSTLGNIDASKVVWADGAKETLAENEIIISQSSFEELCGFLSLEAKPESLAKLPNISRSGYCDSSVFDDSEDVYSDEVKIVGYLPAEDYEDVYQNTLVIDDELYKKYMGSLDGGYSFAIGAMPDKYSEVKSIVKYSYSGKNGVRYSLVNSVTYELDGLDEVFKVLSKAFMYVGLFFAIFASIMMATFISSSISYKKQEIGILRAIGARGSDVFRIFFSESFLIAMINFVLSTTGVGIATALVNRLIRRSTGLLITVLRFGIRQVILLFVISMAIAALASFFPVNHNARKRPIDAIRNR